MLQDVIQYECKEGNLLQNKKFGLRPTARLENDTMEKTKKMTKAQMFKQIMDTYPLTEAEKEFVKHELELLAKKNSAEKKPTAQQTANEAIKTAIVEGMELNRLYTVTEIIKEIPACAEMTNQRVSALLRQLVEGGAVKRTEDKRKAYFSLA